MKNLMLMKLVEKLKSVILTVVSGMTSEMMITLIE